MRARPPAPTPEPAPTTMEAHDTRAPVARDPAAERRAGLAATFASFAIWGVFPLYLKPLAAVPALQVTAHRIVWCCAVVFGWLALRGELAAVRTALEHPQIRRRLVASSLLISANWLIYVWAVANGHLVEASLGYFINPLISVLLGVVVLSERLNRMQWIAVALAAIGVAYLTIASGRLPWIALAVAAAFGMYGLIRKVTPVDAVPGLAVETLLLTPAAGVYLAWEAHRGIGAFGPAGPLVNVLLVGSGLATAVPLALFAAGARRIPLSTVGLLQYVAPTMQFLFGVLVFAEPFPRAHAYGFALIWLALAIYATDGLRRSRALRI